MATSEPFVIRPVQYTDAHEIAIIGVAACKGDRQTQLKSLAKIDYTTIEGTRKRVISTLRQRKQAFIKAVSGTGCILGSCSFAFVGFDENELPELDVGLYRENADDTQSSLAAEDVNVPTDIKDAVEGLDAMEGADMQRWQEVLMPAGSKCIVVTGLSVVPTSQGKGIGSALMKWGTDLADNHGVYMWVHSSEAAFRLYSKCGFEVVGTLDVDLDHWAPHPPSNEGNGAKWGHYLIRYMKRPIKV